MNPVKAATKAACIALMSAVVTPCAKADEWNKKTVVAFSGPVEIPGVHLTGWKILLAVELSRTEKAAVLFTAAEIPVEFAEPIMTVDAPIVLQLKQAPVVAILPSGEEVQLAEVVTAPFGSSSGSGEDFACHSEFFGLPGLLGLLALCGALAFRFAASKFQTFRP
jgi:hypothetical protein